MSCKGWIGLGLVGLLLITAILACDLPSRGVAPDLNAIATQTMQALATTVAAAQAASDASPEQGGAQNPPEEETAPAGEPSPTPTVTLTPTLAPPIVSVSVDTNCRFGPGDVYDYLGALMVGETSEVVAKDSSETFWYIRNPDPPPPFCWVWGFYASIEGDTGPLPVYTPEPTPTPEVAPPPETFSISGHVFRDINQNGLWDPGEIGFKFYNIKVREGGPSGAQVAQTSTDSNGAFRIDGLPAGTYWVKAMPDLLGPSCTLVITRPDSITVTLGPDRQLLFGFLHICGP